MVPAHRSLTVAAAPAVAKTGKTGNKTASQSSKRPESYFPKRWPISKGKWIVCTVQDWRQIESVIQSNLYLINDIFAIPGIPAPLSAMHIASISGDYPLVKLLLTGQADVNNGADTPVGSPLLYAAGNGCPEIVRLLLRNYANPNASNSDGLTPLYIASQNAQASVVFQLLNYGAATETTFPGSGYTPLIVAACYGHTTVLHQLLERQAKTDTLSTCPQQTSALHLASANNRLDAVEILLKQGAQPDIRRGDGATPLMEAVWKGHTCIVKLLLNRLVPATTSLADQKGLSAPTLAVMKGHREVFELLIQSREDTQISYQGNPLLHLAVIHNKSAIVNSILRHDGAVDLKNEQGETPVYLAAAENRTLILSVLLRAGANITLPSHSGKSPYVAAIEAGHENVIRALNNHYLLIRKEPETNARDLLLPALKSKKPQAVRELINSGWCPVDTCLSEDGMTALHIAASEGLSDIVSILIEDSYMVPDFTDYLNKPAGEEQVTPLYMACSRGQLSVVKILIEYQAVRNLAKVESCSLRTTLKTPLQIARQNQSADNNCAEVVSYLEELER